jgi:DNA-binding response OmpR family regulator
MQTDTATEKKRLLIIDDDADILEILETYFTGEGMEVTVSEGSYDILHLIDECRPHVVILDYLLKGVNGGELCHQVKSSKKHGHIPVAIFSAYPRVLQSLGTYGCNLFIPKPFDLDVVKRHVENLIRDHDKDTCLMKQKSPYKNPGIYAR